MDDKLEIKNRYDKLYVKGQQNFRQYFEDNKISEWVKEYMPFIDNETQKIIIEHYVKIKQSCDNNFPTKFSIENNYT